MGNQTARSSSSQSSSYHRRISFIMTYYRPGNDFGIGRGARIRRTISFSGFEPYRTSTPLSEMGGVPTPPPSITSNRPVTPEGVLTQVQEKNKPGRSPGGDSNNTDDLFNDSFDADDIEIPSSNLSQILPNCSIGESKSIREGDQADKMEVVNEPTRESDVLRKVITQTIMGSSVEGNIRRDSLYYGQQTLTFEESKQQQQLWPFIREEDEMGSVAGSGSRCGNQGREEVVGIGTVEGEQRNEKRKYGQGDEERSESGKQYRTQNSTTLSSDQIQVLLGSLTPDSSVIRAEDRFKKQAIMKKEMMPSSDSGAGLKKEDSWGVQIPVQINTEGVPERLVPVAVRSNTESAVAPSASALEIAAAVQQVRHAVTKIVDGTVQSTGLEKHDFAMIDRSMMEAAREPHGGQRNDTGQENYRITIPELIVPAYAQHNVTFDCGGIAKFLLVACNVSTKKWTIPSRQRFHDVLNQVENRIRREFIPCHGVIEWNSEWGGVGLMGLRVADTQALECFRRTISEVQVGGLRYNSYPKDVLAQGMEVSVFLRSELKCLDLEFIPYSLFDKNDLLDGKMAVRYSRESLTTSSSDESQSQEGRLVVLEGDEEFLRSVARYPSNHSFKLGSSTVKIRLNETLEQQHQRKSDIEQAVGRAKESGSGATMMTAMETASVVVSEDLASSGSTPQARFAARWRADPNNSRFPSPVPARSRNPNPDLIIRAGSSGYIPPRNPDLMINQVMSGVGRGRGRNKTWIRGVGTVM